MHRWKILILILVILVLVAGIASAQDTGSSDGFGQGETVCRFVDEDGDGFNDLAPDDDGDGIPNGLDPDFVRPVKGADNKRERMWFGGILSKMFGRALEYQNSVHAFEMESGPGMNSGFGPGEGGPQGSGNGNGEGQANQAGRRGGRQ